MTRVGDKHMLIVRERVMVETGESTGGRRRLGAVGGVPRRTVGCGESWG